MLRVANGDSERVGSVGAARVSFRQQDFNHHGDLPLFRMAGSNNGFLDQIGSVFGDRNTRQCRYHEGDAARLAKFQRRLWIAVDEGLLNGSFFRHMRLKHICQTEVELPQTLAKR